MIRLNISLLHKRLRFNGKLIVTTDNQAYPILVQLWDKEKFVAQRTVVPNTQKAEFDQLMPAEFTVKLVYDTNANGKWDEGSFYEKRQAEDVYFYPELVKVRSDWDIEIDAKRPVGK